MINQNELTIEQMIEELKQKYGSHYTSFSASGYEIKTIEGHVLGRGPDFQAAVRDAHERHCASPKASEGERETADNCEWCHGCGEIESVEFGPEPCLMCVARERLQPTARPDAERVSDTDVEQMIDAALKLDETLSEMSIGMNHEMHVKQARIVAALRELRQLRQSNAGCQAYKYEGHDCSAPDCGCPHVASRVSHLSAEDANRIKVARDSMKLVPHLAHASYLLDAVLEGAKNVE